jgi:predicted transcriptional regulator of viral defense system
VAERGQLLEAGLSERVIDYRLETGRYRGVHERVYSLGPLSMRGRLVAALLAGGEDAVLCHASALVPYRLRTSVVTIDLAVRRQRRDEPQLRFHRLSLAENEVTRRDGLRVTTIERTLFDIAATGAGIRHLAQEAVAKRLTTQAKLMALADRHRRERVRPRYGGSPANPTPGAVLSAVSCASSMTTDFHPRSRIPPSATTTSTATGRSIDS